MKVRWTGGSLRLRITPTELAALVRGEEIREALRLPGGGVTWSIVVRPFAAPKTGITYTGPCPGGVLLNLAAADVERLARPDVEGVYFRSCPEDTEPGVSLAYFIEKDFPCLHPRPADALEPSAETFAPPPGFAERKA
jgi:hypothetical protein